MKRRVYFAHPMSDYGSDRERRALEALEAAGYQVENPAAEEHAMVVESIRQGVEGDPGEAIMAYFVKVAVDCDALAFQAFPSDLVGAGVALEVQAFEHAWQGERPVMEVYELARWGNERRVALLPCVYGAPAVAFWRRMSVGETRRALRELREQEKTNG